MAREQAVARLEDGAWIDGQEASRVGKDSVTMIGWEMAWGGEP
jgi:hypothetical protein